MNIGRFGSISGMLLLLTLAIIFLVVSLQKNVPTANVSLPASQQATEQASPSVETPSPQATMTTVSSPTDAASPPPEATLTPWPTPIQPTGLPITVIPVPTGSPGIIVFPTPNPTEAAQDERSAYLYNLLVNRPGAVIGQGTNATPNAGGFQSYIVEEVTLPDPTNFADLTGVDLTVSTIWRVTLTGQNFISGDLAWSVWLDDNPIGTAQENARGITAIAYDRSALREGAIIKAGYGGRPTIELPERLHLSVQP